jgi:hypothetical protein
MWYNFLEKCETLVLLPAIFLSQQVGLFNTDISQLNPASIVSKKVDANLKGKTQI